MSLVTATDAYDTLTIQLTFLTLFVTLFRFSILQNVFISKHSHSWMQILKIPMTNTL